MELGKALRLLRKDKGISQKEMAEACGLSLNTIRNVEAGKQFPYKYTIDIWTKKLGTSSVEVLLLALSDEQSSQKVKECAEELADAIRNEIRNKK